MNPIPMAQPDLSQAELDAVSQVLKTSYLSIGPRIVEFERAFADYIGVKHAVGVSSGTAGLHLCVIAAGITENDLVITSPFSFVASANCFLYERALPVFVDIDPDTLNVDPQQVEQAVHDIKHDNAQAKHWLPPSCRDRVMLDLPTQLKVILPVHAFGQPADMVKLSAIAKEHDLVIIEDACEAIGAEYQGRKAGQWGESAVFGFYPNKQITTGEGGMIVTNNETWYHLFRSLRNQGRDVFNAWLNHTRLGYNYRLDEMSAALGLVQLNRLESFLAKREQVATWYNERLKEISAVTIPYIVPEVNRMSWFVYVIRLAEEIDRNKVMDMLKEKGIPSRPYFTPIHLQTFYQDHFGYRPGDFPVTESVAKSVLALPFYANLSEAQVDYVCTTLNTVLNP